MSKGITQKMADKMVMYRIIGRDSYGEAFTHGPDIKSYAKAVKELEGYRQGQLLQGARRGVKATYTLIEVTCKVLSI